MNLENETNAQRSQKQKALAAAMPLPDYEPDLQYCNKEFTRKPKSGLFARPNHLGDGIVQDLPEGF